MVDSRDAAVIQIKSHIWTNTLVLVRFSELADLKKKKFNFNKNQYWYVTFLEFLLF